MQYDRGIWRQQGHGLGGLLRLAASVMKNVMSGLLGGVSEGGGPSSPPYYPPSRNYYPPPPPPCDRGGEGARRALPRTMRLSSSSTGGADGVGR